ncbi:patatin-like phospholipase family protein [Asticcacaulis biprosthecium C19]|uniref:Patatin-like phospholipase family protein n=1 Tax=Asticcacaulis biprosthecium C19 TaxID=715226 RepID=F4QK67_9CAUL|nr:patatin-like phospholipase family protein [Asticcacaulis biprosthecium]EGF93245.1 patatin-like phospholipase family protein [Asticcacaulis biprosthecium C19]
MLEPNNATQLPKKETELPEFNAEQFELQAPPECDMIMKGGITSGIVYPYAILQIATKFRLRSLGGTSAGAIAAAFAAAAEYARQNGRPEGFIILKHYCDQLPEKLLSLFQPSESLKPAVDGIKAALRTGDFKLLVRRAGLNILIPAVLASVVCGLGSYLIRPDLYTTVLAVLLSGILAGAAGLGSWIKRTILTPLLIPVAKALKELPDANFGFCTGLTQPGNSSEGLTNWIHLALQHIAFGDPNYPTPLTFGDLRGQDPAGPQIDLKVVTTNLSMKRPHTLPKLGMLAGFRMDEWDKLFPASVMTYLSEGTEPWKELPSARLFPSEDKLPVLVAVRMSLSFPLLFTAVPLMAKDTELTSIATTLGAPPVEAFRKVHLSDGGISSNFPIHMFDAPLPTRPTFAFSLEDLTLDGAATRVALPQSARDGMGVQIKEIQGLADFARQILNAAKDWQDQLLSEITGQRERIVRIFLNKAEGGLNLNMSKSTSRQLMRLGYEAGCKFTDTVENGGFDFDEHKWRRLLVLYKHLDDNLEAIDRVWSADFKRWYPAYAPAVKTYRNVTLGDREAIAGNLARLLEVRKSERYATISRRDAKFPKKAGTLKVGPKY